MRFSSGEVLMTQGVVVGWRWLVSANFERLVLGCIEAKFCKFNIRWRALDEIYKIYMLLHRSDLNMSAKNRKMTIRVNKVNRNP